MRRSFLLSSSLHPTLPWMDQYFPQCPVVRGHGSPVSAPVDETGNMKALDRNIIVTLSSGEAGSLSLLNGQDNYNRGKQTLKGAVPGHKK